MPRTTSPRIAEPCAERRAAPRVSVNRPSRRVNLEQVTARVRRGRAHPSTEAKGWPFAALCRAARTPLACRVELRHGQAAPRADRNGGSKSWALAAPV
jgi:hypothetical protein